MRLPSDLPPSAVTAICDTREQIPLDLSPLQVVTDSLDTGDYSVKGLQGVVRVERKSLEDLVQCCGSARERFQREIDRLMGFSSRLLLVEASWADVLAGQWRSQVTPNSVAASILSWQAMGLPVLLAGDHAEAGHAAAKFLFLVARRRWREARTLAAEINEDMEVMV